MSSSRSGWTDSSVAVRSGEELEVEALARFLSGRLHGFDGELTVEQFPSGFSNLTYRLHAEATDGPRDWVLRRPPFGANIATAHDMAREFRILSHLATVFPKVPTPRLYCDDSEVLGAPFYVMERIEGVILRSKMPREMIPDAELMGGIAESLIETLAELHAVDYRAAGLDDLGKPDGYIERQVSGWTKRWLAARIDEVPELEQVTSWLARNQPARNESKAALIHNDFKYDNLVLDPGDWTRVRAVLDWEMATLGDPLMDLGTTLGYWLDPDDPPALQALALSPTTLAGNPRRVDVVETYARTSGRAVDSVVFYYVYGLFKLAVIIQQIYSRYVRGLTRDPRFAGLGEGVRQCGLAATQAIAKERIDRLFDV